MDKHKERIMEVASRNTVMSHKECIQRWGDEKGMRIFDKLVREVMRWNEVTSKDIHMIKQNSDGRE